MNVKDFTFLLQHPDQVITAAQTKQLEEVLVEYPYFQTARALHLKGLKNLNSFKYNNALKVTAAYTTDRGVLFDYITSEAFSQDRIAAAISGKTELLEPVLAPDETVDATPENTAQLIEDSIDKPLPQTVEDADSILHPQLFTSKDPEGTKSLDEELATKDQPLELGQPLLFTKTEKHSFEEWLKLTTVKKIEHAGRPATLIEKGDKKDSAGPKKMKSKKIELIDKFIASNPKIVPHETPVKIDLGESTKFDGKELMTETLARVYLEQRKYKKAIQAYRILSLKYPEKSGFFADRIKAVEKIKQENTSE
jgi:hypothetical protein